MSSNDLPLSRQDAAVIAGRILCVLFLFYAISNLFELPSLLLGLTHYGSQGNKIVSQGEAGYWTAKYVGFVGGALARAAIELWLAKTFYQCGPRVRRFLGVWAPHESQGDTSAKLSPDTDGSIL